MNELPFHAVEPSSSAGAPWQFWIDVGGTFTDCFGRRPDGSLVRCKVLSSGATKGVATAADDGQPRLIDAARQSDPPGFWIGYRCRFIDRAGQVLGERMVVEFDRATGTLVLDSPADVVDSTVSYELVSGEEAPILAIRWLLGLRLDQSIPPLQLKLGTTRGTNALLTRGGAATAFVTTRGFGDILRIGYQNRPRLFDLAIRKPPPLYAEVVEIDERVTPAGEVLIEPDADRIREQLRAAKQRGIVSLAVCLLHAWCRPEHERLVGRLAREVGFDEISLSHEVAPMIKIVSRGDTTVVDAYLNPVLRSYVASLRSSLKPPADIRLLTSAGGLARADQFRGKDSLLSGPAGGVVGFSKAIQAAGFTHAIGFDMGGTSTDVSRFDGRYEFEYETERAGVRVVAPMMGIETVAAGGGSICNFDGVKLTVGPASAGADPGPACYGRGGPLTITDVNLFLGRLRPQHFPFPLDTEPVSRRLAELVERIAVATGRKLESAELAEGFLRIANTKMASAIRSISVAKGCDPRRYVLAAFGGAAPQHACGVARELGMTSILIHPDASLLSALGIGLADIARHKVEAVHRPYSESAVAELQTTFARLADAAVAEVLAEGVAADHIEVTRLLDLRYRGVEAILTIAEPPDGNYAAAYAEEHRRLYGFVHEHRPLEIVAARISAVGHAADSLPASQRGTPYRPNSEDGGALIYCDGRPQVAALNRRENLRPGATIDGPTMIVEPNSTTIVDPGWTAEVLSGGELLLRIGAEIIVGRIANPSVSPADGLAIHPTAADPISLEIFNNRFTAIAEQMGITLRNTASSVNVKERLDFSCAVFTPAGDLVVNAPHIPVHLGAMSETVKCILADNPAMRPGDVFVTNDPYRGGSHLPDITVVTPVYELATGRLLFFTASRAHHAEIGGITPGSMPPGSRNMAEEGVLIRNFKLFDAGQPRHDDLRRLLTAGSHPSRNPDDNLADINAQVAANRQGVRDLLALVERESLPRVAAYMSHIQQAAETKMRAALRRLPAGRHEFIDHLDDGAVIRVAVTVVGDRATIDFTGTSGVLPGNLNATKAIVTAAVIYCLRCLIDEDIPLNQGVLAPIELIVPECLLNPPAHGRPEDCAAVAGGNVETSQRIVDVLLGALKLAAASQGTMNNLLFGDATFGYYETICGGSGATPDSDGADAIHTHMTNTRLTDPEVLEQRFPVRVREFAIRRGSGGAGQHRGGDGVIRRLEFLRPLQVSILSQRRGPFPPYGLLGGSPGVLGENTVQHADGTSEILPAQITFPVTLGDILTIKSPGAGGCGEVRES